ncbi:MAG: hypothetical protein U0836_22620 [Pirellulales bacterium]
MRLDLADYALPTEATIVVEAYHSAYYRRFACGTVGAPDFTRQKLADLESGDQPLFRIKVRDSAGRLLAAVDEVRPETDESSGFGGSLLPIRARSRAEMGDEFWRLHFVGAEASDTPELHINRDVPGLYNALQNRDPLVTGLLMPEVLRKILRNLTEGGQEWSDDPWLTFAWDLVQEEFEEWEGEDSRRARQEWVDRVVSQFAARHRFVGDYIDQRTAGASPGGESDA